MCNIEADLKNSKTIKNTVNIRSHKNIDIEAFKNEIRKSNLNNHDEYQNATNATILYNNELKRIYDTLCPVKVISINASKESQKWYNAELREMKRDLRQKKKDSKANVSR